MLDSVAEARLQGIVSAIPLRRAGKPRDIAGVCLVLALDLAAYVAGAAIDGNGASHIHYSNVACLYARCLRSDGLLCRWASSTRSGVAPRRWTVRSAAI